MKRILLTLLCLLWASAAFAQIIGDGMGSPYGGTAKLYQGPGNIVSGATAWYGLRGYSAAYASPGTNKSVNLRRASDNATCDFVVASSGNLGGTAAACAQGSGLSLAAFATTDATASCTIATTLATCTGASSTPHVGSSVTGAGVAQPCYITTVGSFTGGAGTVGIAGNGTSSPCGTIGVAASLTFTYGLFTTDAYDQSGNTNDAVQATAANQPELIPQCLNSLPCILTSGGAVALNLQTSANVSLGSNPLTMSVVSERRSVGSNSTIFGNSNGPFVIYAGSANVFGMFAGSVVTVAATDNVFHAAQATFNGAASVFYLDGSANTLSPGTTTANTHLYIGTDGFNNFCICIFLESGGWTGAFSSGNRSTMNSNQHSYWGF